MKSHELLREVIQAHNPKAMAEEMGVSVSMVYKWRSRRRGSGAVNPLDRWRGVEDDGDVRVAEWICGQVDGFFIKNPKVGG